jgi:hypothetical protein
MKEIDMSQRIEEIELALSTIFESPKAPAISSYDDGATCFIQASWVIESHADTTLDSRCVLTIRFTRTQIQRYAEMNTAQRIVVRDRMLQMVKRRLPLESADASLQTPSQGDCAEELQMDDRLFEVDDPLS